MQPVVNPSAQSSSTKASGKRSAIPNQNIKYEKQPVEDLIPNLKFILQNRLGRHSHPADWVCAFIPESQKKGDSNGCGISKWCQYTNMKAEMDFASGSQSGGLSYKFTPFTPREIEQHLSLYIVQGLNPSPQLRMKAQFQHQEQVQGNDLIATSIGNSFDCQHKQFKRYFAIQHP